MATAARAAMPAAQRPALQPRRAMPSSAELTVWEPLVKSEAELG